MLERVGKPLEVDIVKFEEAMRAPTGLSTNPTGKVQDRSKCATRMSAPGP
ncbi:MAG: hypothetical protein AAGJ94_04460 [Pseudomonadota bacterium]